MSDIILSCKDIVRDFETPGGIVHVLKGISIEAPRGKLTILRGRSGSGKTTLINSLGTLDTPTSGQVILDGRDITGLSTTERDAVRRSDYGFVFQSTALVGMMSAFENVEFSLRISGMKNPQERRARALECLRMVELSKRVDHMPGEMSGGEQQRVAIARAIAHKPKVIFADEPTAALDTQMGIHVMSIFKALIEKEGVTVIMTTHDPSMMEIADRVYTLEDGEVVDVR
ncbi:MAG: ABC transporter ATP-binding protein [Clostridia bacterium]|nr:ABC transporter ATP-binding protein [Clostridia bacterium]